MLKSETVSKLSLGVAICSVIVTIIFALAAMNHSTELAKKSGQFRQGKVEALIGHIRLTPEKTHRLVFGVNESETTQGLVISPYQLAIRNSGDAQVRDISVLFRYHSMLKRKALEHLSFSLAGGMSGGDVTRTFSSLGATDFVSYQIEKLNPAVAMAIDEPFVLGSTLIEDSVDVEGLTVPFKLLYSLNFQVSLSSAVDQVADYNFEATVLAANDLAELEHQFYREIVLHEAKELRENSSFFQYLGALIFGVPEEQAVLIYPHTHRVGEPGALIFFPQEGEVEYRTAWYAPVSWVYLFGF